MPPLQECDSNLYTLCKGCRDDVILPRHRLNRRNPELSLKRRGVRFLYTRVSFRHKTMLSVNETKKVAWGRGIVIVRPFRVHCL